MATGWIPILFAIPVIAFARGQKSESSIGWERVSATAVIQELNLARQNPALYADFLEEVRKSRSGDNLLRMRGGTAALDEAIRFLRTARPQAALVLSPGLCQAAADHCRDQAAGTIGHNGSDRSSPDSRINRYGRWEGGWAENIAYGHRSARGIVLALIIDDGIRGRGHRKNIFNAIYNVAGAAYGPHARFGSVCDIDFAGGYVESALASAN